MAHDTKQRILETAKRLFNEQGYGRITTSMLAKEVGIAEGNLWYHFKSKRDLLEAISEEFLIHCENRVKINPSNTEDIIGEYIRYIDAFMYELREFRFLYRDQTDYGEHSDGLLTQLPELYAQNQKQLKSFFRSMMTNGLLDWKADRLDELAINTLVIIRFFMEYVRETQQSASSSSGVVRRAFLQHLTLIEEKLDAESTNRLRAAILQSKFKFSPLSSTHET